MYSDISWVDIVERMDDMLRTETYMSPCGGLLLGSIGDALCMCDWIVEGRTSRTVRRIGKVVKSEMTGEGSDVTAYAARQLDEFFEGRRTRFDIPLLMVGTVFQKKVWKGLLDIPFGKSVSYKELAVSVGMSGAVRAVANAVGANPVSIFVPCHRVIGADGSLTGYAGGLYAKRVVLGIEGLVTGC